MIDGYNAAKHDRHKQFKEANFGNLIDAVAGLVALLSSQFGDYDFEGPYSLTSSMPRTSATVSRLPREIFLGQIS